jgi:PKD repeat protein
MRRLFVAVCALACAAVGFAVPLQTAQAAATNVVADWQLNEGAGATAMVDVGPNHLDGQIAADAAAHGLTTGVTEGVDTFYDWANRCPACEPVEDSRVIQVPDNDLLDIPDPTTTWSLEFRFRTTRPFGNIMQKGHSSSKGGQVKVQAPAGIVQCLFKGADGTRVGTGSPERLDDGEWHTVECVRTETQVKQFVDGVRVAVKNGSTGAINNNKPFTVGGKIPCDQITITCDYFVGDIDWVTIRTDAPPPGNQPPKAQFTNDDCPGRLCTFTSASTDNDGTIDSYAWTFGDGATSTAQNPTHQYAAPGTYTVTLTVTDNEGAADKVAHPVVVNPAEPPGPPGDVSAASGDRSATVSWRAPASQGDSPITAYVITTVPGGLSTTVPATARSAEMDGLRNGSTYQFTVAATNQAGTGDSAGTNAIRPAGLPRRATDLHSKARRHGAAVMWSPADGNGARILSYRVQTSTGKHQVVAGTVRRAVFQNMRSGAKVTFRVRAISRVGAGPWTRWTARVTVG